MRKEKAKIWRSQISKKICSEVLYPSLLPLQFSVQTRQIVRCIYSFLSNYNQSTRGAAYGHDENDYFHWHEQSHLDEYVRPSAIEGHFVQRNPVGPVFLITTAGGITPLLAGRQQWKKILKIPPAMMAEIGFARNQMYMMEIVEDKRGGRDSNPQPPDRQSGGRIL